jgi:hypothetical protein
MESENFNKINNFRITTNWPVHAKNLQARYSDLTENDLEFSPNEEKNLIMRIAKRLNKKQFEVIQLIESTAPRIL